VYAGHYAAGLTLKANQPQASAWALLLGVGLLDVLFGIFVMLGIERVTVTPGVSPGFSLDFIDWSHSLTMSLVWAVLFSNRTFCWTGRCIPAIWRCGHTPASMSAWASGSAFRWAGGGWNSRASWPVARITLCERAV
jgi:hypothetical protein